MATRTEEQWIVPFARPEATLESVGGKGASLARLVAAGFPVPPGFIIRTDAYRQFVAEAGLQPVIDARIATIDPDDPGTLQEAATEIQAAFRQAPMPAGIADAIDRAYADLGVAPVAVRSSATAEDLPGFSFAGQQETVLDVRGEAAVREAVHTCWASLWTARAIGYRRQMGVPGDGVAMAVVVQRLVPAKVSGVLFTANPATGNRGEIVIDATRGLGENLVGGTVTPESYVVDRQTITVTSFVPAPGSDTEHLTMAGGSGTGTTGDGSRGEEGRLLTGPLLRELCTLGLRVEAEFDGTPQDIEWAIADGSVWLLQARPITNLPAPLLEVSWEPPTPGTTWVRRQVVEHMPEPLSPLFEELYLREGLEQAGTEIARAMDIENIFELMIDGPYFTTVHGYGYSRGDIDLPREAIPLLIRASVQGIGWIFRHGGEHWQTEGLPRYVGAIARWQDRDPNTATDDELLRGIRALATADAVYWFAAAIAIGAAKVSDSVLGGLLSFIAPGSGLSSALFLRGYPSKTLEAEAELDAIAQHVRGQEELRDFVLATPADRLLDNLPHTPAGLQLRAELEQYFARYGHQIYNLDFVAPTLAESPLPVLLGLKALVREVGHDAVSRQTAVARERDRLTVETARSFDPVRRFLFRRVVRWAQRYASYREDALFYVGAAWPLVRRFARELGQRLTQAGTLRTADDVYFLRSGELAAASAARAAGQARPDLARLAEERHELREQRMRLHPPAAVPPTGRMHMGRLDFSDRETQRRNAADAMVLQGFAVSPGRVTAPASVIRSPADFARMEPGTILVCPTTTPAWTPLFAQARGLVTDIGGILAHGSIVAREYGIPAVMGTGNATQRITNGQQITVDGTAGTVSLQPD